MSRVVNFKDYLKATFMCTGCEQRLPLFKLTHTSTYFISEGDIRVVHLCDQCASIASEYIDL